MQLGEERGKAEASAQEAESLRHRLAAEEQERARLQDAVAQLSQGDLVRAREELSRANQGRSEAEARLAETSAEHDRLKQQVAMLYTQLAEEQEVTTELSREVVELQRAKGVLEARVEDLVRQQQALRSELLRAMGGAATSAPGQQQDKDDPAAGAGGSSSGPTSGAGPASGGSTANGGSSGVGGGASAANGGGSKGARTRPAAAPAADTSSSPADMADLAAELSSLVREAGRAVAELARVQSELAERSAALVEQTSRVAALEVECGRLAALSTSLEEERASLRAQVRLLEADRSVLEGRLLELQAQRDQLQRQVEALAPERESFRLQAEQASAGLAGTRARLEEVERRAAELAGAEQLACRLAAELEERSTEAADLRASLSGAHGQLELARSQSVQLARELDAARDELASRARRASALDREDLLALRTELARLQSTNRHLEQQCEELKSLSMRSRSPAPSSSSTAAAPGGAARELGAAAQRLLRASVSGFRSSSPTAARSSTTVPMVPMSELHRARDLCGSLLRDKFLLEQCVRFLSASRPASSAAARPTENPVLRTILAKVSDVCASGKVDQTLALLGAESIAAAPAPASGSSPGGVPEPPSSSPWKAAGSPGPRGTTIQVSPSGRSPLSPEREVDASLQDLELSASSPIAAAPDEPQEEAEAPRPNFAQLLSAAAVKQQMGKKAKTPTKSPKHGSKGSNLKAANGAPRTPLASLGNSSGRPSLVR